MLRKRPQGGISYILQCMDVILGIGTKLLCPSRHIDMTGTITKPHVNAHQTSYLAAKIELVRGSVKIKKLVVKRNTEAGDDHTIRHMQHSHVCVRLQSLIQRCHTTLRYRVSPLNTQSHTQAHHEQRNNQSSRHTTPTRSSSVKAVLNLSMSAKAQAPSSAMLHPLCNKSSQCRNMCKMRAHQHFAASHLPSRFAVNSGCFSKHSPTLPHSPSRRYYHS